ncbi:response regulator transcription factor [Halobacillus campisalis]|uniref:Response regulator transcription factor n=1 Tax=Halobacillus campisalis TaxID=435909 RepID=A0ABW2K598_9BACI
MSYTKIAKSIHISEHTVKVHIRNIYSKLKVKNKVELILKYSEK